MDSDLLELQDFVLIADHTPSMIVPSVIDSHHGVFSNIVIEQTSIGLVCDAVYQTKHTTGHTMYFFRPGDQLYKI